MQTNILRVICACALLLSFSLQAIEIPQAERDRITQEVITELGRYDAAEIEKRARLWLVEQPLPPSTGELVDGGNCVSGCRLPEVRGVSLPEPKNVKVKGKKNKGYYSQHLQVKWKRPSKLPSDSPYRLNHYLVHVSKDNAEYQVYKVDTKFKNNGKPKKKQKIQFQNLPDGDYLFQVQAVYENIATRSGSSNKEYQQVFTRGSSGGGSVKGAKKDVGDLQGHANALYACVSSIYADTVTLDSITNPLDCSNSGLDDADLDNSNAALSDFIGLTSINISNNPLINDFSALADLPNLSWLDISYNTGIQNWDLLPEIDTFIMVAVNAPAFPQGILGTEISYIDVSQNSIATWLNFLPTVDIDVFKMNDNTANVNFNDMNGKSIETLELKNSSLTDIDDLSGINGLKNLVLDGSNLTGITDISSYSGFCSLSLDNTNIEELNGHRPISFLSLQNIESLAEINTIGYFNNGTEIYLPNDIKLVGSNNQLCEDYYQKQNLWNTIQHVDMSSSFPVDMGGGATANSPVCPPYLLLLNLYGPAQSCMPNEPKEIKVYDESGSNRLYLEWEEYDTQQQWGVTHYEFELFDGAGNFISRANSDVLNNAPLVSNVSGIAIVKGRICLEDKCGDWKEINQPWLQGMHQITSPNNNWQDNAGTTQFKIKFYYPVVPPNTFEQPDYFKLTAVGSSTPIADIPFSSASVDWRFKTDWLDFSAYNTDVFEIQSCRHDVGCGAPFIYQLTDVPNVTTPDDFNLRVYSDTATVRKYLFWDEAATGLVEYYKVILENSNCPVGATGCVQKTEELIELGSSQPFVVYGSTYDSFKVAACSNSDCTESQSVGPADYDQALTRVENINYFWDAAGENFHFEWVYDETVFNTGVSEGRPTHFLISPVFPQRPGVSEADYPQVIVGPTYQATWNSTSATIGADEFLGMSYSIRACNSDYCGAEAPIVVSTAITDDSLPVPQKFSVTTPNISTPNEWSLNWSGIQGNADVDYIEVVEDQPVMRDGWAYSDLTLPDEQQVTYYIEPDGNYKLQRIVKGGYGFKVRSCHRDRIRGDSCSAFTEVEPKQIDQGTINTADQQIINLNWMKYQAIESNGNETTRYGVEWNHDTGATGVEYPDYFQVNVIGLSSSCLGRNDRTFIVENVTSNFEHISQSQSKYTTRDVCETIPDGNSQVQVQSCYYGQGCTASATIPASGPDRDNAIERAPLCVDGTCPGTRNVVGGPGDLNPGVWSNPLLESTGWYFNWAGDLRDATSRQDFKSTYDLVGFWTAYRIMDDVWTPVWLHSSLKLVQGCSPLEADNPQCDSNYQFYQGRIEYITKLPGQQAQAQSIGRLNVFFDDSDPNERRNSRVVLNIDLDADNGILTQMSTLSGGGCLGNESPFDASSDCARIEDDGSLSMPIKDIERIIEEDNGLADIGNDNDNDHYSGLYAPQGADILNRDYSFITDIRGNLDWSALAIYDSQGHPIWMLGARAFDGNVNDVCIREQKEYCGYFFETVPEGFNPMLYSPNRGILSQRPLLPRTDRKPGGRRLGLNGFRSGEFWANIVYGSGDLPGRNGASVNFIEGSGPGLLTVPWSNKPVQNDTVSGVTTEPMYKVGSLHEIRFAINDHAPGDQLTCDPDVEGECLIRFDWFTDDDFIDITPYYSKDGGTYQPLSNICSNPPVGYVTIGFECLISEAGNYEFVLTKARKDVSAITPEPQVVIAKSEILTVEACDDARGCQGESSGIPSAPPATPPAPMNMLGSVTADPLNDLVGVTSGAFDVDQSGAANYHIPIFAPEGRGGLAPQLALSYNSMSGNGIAGMGWRINGTSSISRCLKSAEHDPSDNFYPAIGLDWDDALCLDGMRLIKVAETATEIEYRKEIDDFSKIIAHKDSTGNSGNGPKEFTVYSKNGDVWLYGSPSSDYKADLLFIPSGNTGAQIIGDDGLTVHTWLLASISDRHNNSIRFLWDTDGGANYLSQVAWSNFDANGAPHYQIDFIYAANRADAMHAYTVGVGGYEKTYYLDRVSTFIRTGNFEAANTQEVRRLKLAYQQPHTTANPGGSMRLESITQCLNNGTCLNPVTFEWDNNNSNIGIDNNNFFQTNALGAMLEMGYGSYKQIDINGDGLSELLYLRHYDDGNIAHEDNEVRFWLAFDSSSVTLSDVYECDTMSGGYFDKTCDLGIEPFSANVISQDRFNSDRWFIFDFNGDGKQDFLAPRQNGTGGYTWHVAYTMENAEGKLSLGQVTPRLGGGIDTQTDNLNLDYYHTEGGSSFLDYTADGIPDLLTFDENPSEGNALQYRLYPSQLSGNSYLPGTVDSQFLEMDENLLAPLDLMCENLDPLDANPISCVLHSATLVGGNLSNVGLAAEKLEVVPTDFNGDGYNDAILSYSYRYASGSGCEFNTNPQSPPLRSIDDFVAAPYTGKLLTNKGSGTNKFTPSNDCEHSFRAAMVYNKAADGTISFEYGGRLGLAKTEPEPMAETLVITSCGEVTQQSGSDCNPHIDSSNGAGRIMDINGDGLGDFVYLDTTYQYKYKLNQGKSVASTLLPIPSNPANARLYNRVIFDDELSANLPSMSSQDCSHGVDDNSDVTACGRRLSTQFLDYDMDGDTDILYPQGNQYYVAYYGRQINGSFGYGSGISTNQTAYNLGEKPQHYNNVFADFNGDGHMDYYQIYRKDQNNKRQVFKYGNNRNQVRDKITSIITVSGNPAYTGGKENRIDIDYLPATDPDVYSMDTGSLTSLTSYGEGSPVIDIISSQYVVSDVSKTAPTEANPGYMSTVNYYYTGMKVQGGGRGSLGFASIETNDSEHNVLTITEYRQDFPYIGMPKTTTTNHFDAQNNSYQLSVSEQEHDVKVFTHASGEKSYFPYIKRSKEKSNTLNTTITGEVNGVTAHKVVLADFTYGDNYGNLTSSETRICTGNISLPAEGVSSSSVCKTSDNSLVERQTTSNQYQHDNVTEWILGRLSASTVTTERKMASGYDVKSRQSGFEYDPVTGQLIEERIGNTSDEKTFLRTMHKYDTYGQLEETYQCSSHLTVDQFVNQCTNKSLVIARPQSQSQYYIHRYKRYEYDSIWNEYVDQEFQPFTEGDTGFDHNDIADVTALENGTFNFPSDVASEHPLQVITGRDIYGSPIQVDGLDDNEATTKTAYGVFGQVHATGNNIGGLSITTLRWCNEPGNPNQCPVNAAMVNIQTTQGAPTSRTYHDQLGREIRSQQQNMQGQWITTDTWYDALGRTVKQSEPYLRSLTGNAVTAIHHTSTKYDALDRITLITAPNYCVEAVGASNTPNQCVTDNYRITTTTYNGLTTQVINPNGQSKTSYYDETGQITQVIDAMGTSILYDYDAHQNLTSTISLGNTITMGYDNYGRKTSMSDPDKGNWVYNQNALGELVSQTDGKGQVTTNYYDVQGRLYYRHEPYAQSIWEFDTAIDLSIPASEENKLGQLRREYAFGEYTKSRQNDVIARGRGLVTEYYQDTYGRPVRTHHTILNGYDSTGPLVNGGTSQYNSYQTYDQYGRAFQSTDASGFGVLFQYNNYGYQTITRDSANGFDGQIYHEVLETDARGNVIKERYHNRFESTRSYDDASGFIKNIQAKDNEGLVVQELYYAFDAIGNLIRRTDVTDQNTFDESYEYDQLNRLKSEFLNNVGDVEKSYQYDASGNLIQKGLTSMNYDSTQPHALDSAGNYTYKYDANGNMYERTDSTNTLMQLNIEYTSFDKPDYITGRDSDNNLWENYIAYDANHSRYLRVDLRNNLEEHSVTHYLPGVEFVYKVDSIKAKRYIGNLVVHVEIDTGVSGELEPQVDRNLWEYNYLLKDHIGSTHTVVNQYGLATAHMSFGAWGQRRKAAPSPSDVFVPIAMDEVWSELGQTIENTTNRGFTGHEHFDQLGIIHMNGRIYDPAMGRFLQADPLIQDPYDTQSLNRYSYVMNNPLSYTDPTGYFRLRKGFWRTALAVGITAIPGLQSFGGVLVKGALAGFVTTGDLDGALKGAFQAGLTYGIGEAFGTLSETASAGEKLAYHSGKALAHGIVGGISSEMDGGKFGHGFTSAALGSGADAAGINQIENSVSRIIANAIIQGAISEATGGKFANGAISGAFRVAFNDLSHEEGELSEQDNRSKDYEEYLNSLSKEEQKALNKAFNSLSLSAKIDEHNNRSRQNNYIGLGVFEVGDGFDNSAPSYNTISGRIEQSPTGKISFFGSGDQTLYQASQKGLHSLVFRVKRDNQIMMNKSDQFQNLSDRGGVPVIVVDVYNRKRFLWRPRDAN